MKYNKYGENELVLKIKADIIKIPVRIVIEKGTYYSYVRGDKIIEVLDKYIENPQEKKA